jgi:putative transposase
MSRPLRIEYPDAWYHVMNRGRRGENVFADEKDYCEFLALLQEASTMFGLRVAAFCLLSDHYHLLVQTPGGNLSRVMRHINGVYTQRYNRSKKFDGQLFRGRYKSILVGEDSYLLELLRYIHRNPVRAKICESIDAYPWSSHHGYVSNGQKWDWLYTSFLLDMFSEESGKAKKGYSEFVQCADDEEVTNFFNKKKQSSVFGSALFGTWVKEKYYAVKKNNEVPESQELAPTIAEIKKVVSQCCQVDESSIGQSRRGQVNEARNLAIYLARKHCGFRLEEIGKDFGLDKYSSVSSIVVRTEKLLSQSDALQKRLKRIVHKLNKFELL